MAYIITCCIITCCKVTVIRVFVVCAQDKVEINLRDKNGKTPLMLATGRKHDKVIMYLQKELKQRNSLIPRIDAW